MAGQRQQALEQVRQLLRELHEKLPAEDAEMEIQRQSTHKIVALVERHLIHLQPLLQSLLFTDVMEVDEGVIALNEWNAVLRETMAILQTAHDRFNLVPLVKFKPYTAIHTFMFELHKVLNKCIFRLGQITLPAGTVISPNFNI